jgi:uncharacterized membrane protein
VCEGATQEIVAGFRRKERVMIDAFCEGWGLWWSATEKPYQYLVTVWHDIGFMCGAFLTLALAVALLVGFVLFVSNVCHNLHMRAWRRAEKARKEGNS